MKRPSPARERGVVLILTLIVLLIMTIGAVALVRSMNTSQVSAGNLAFRHDLVNQGEQALSSVLQAFQTGGLLASSTTDDVPAANYSATMLAANAQGIPSLLLANDSTFSATMKHADLTGATSDVTIRYVIDRLCNGTGPATASACIQSAVNLPNYDPGQGNKPPPPSSTLYRLSVRVTGPRNTQIFLQSNISKPD